MFLDSFPLIDPELVSSVEYSDDGLDYDLSLFELGKDLDQFVVLNPEIGKELPVNVLQLIEKVKITEKCVIWHYDSQWIAKLFHKNWKPNDYLFIELKLPRLIWKRNPAISPSLSYHTNPILEYKPNIRDLNLELFWCVDEKFTEDGSKEWAISCTYHGREIIDKKYMGVVEPNIDVEWNPDLPKLNVDLENLYPPFWYLDRVTAWSIDDRYSPEDNTWMVKFIPSGTTHDDWEWLGVITPEFQIEQNPDVPKLNIEFDYHVPWHDLSYIHTWYMDDLKTGEKIWVIKLIPSAEIVGEKDMGEFPLTYKVEQNPDLPKLEFSIDYKIPWHELCYEHVWYLNKKIQGEKIWAVRVTPPAEIIGVKEVGVIDPNIPDQLDVIFISYNEPNAEENWKRVLEKAPWAKRVDGVKGIFNAHKKAARLSKTDMFYVVDGDAYLVDDWKFDFQPSLFDRDCAYVWSSTNPVNNLVYQNGGVKLFSKKVLMKKRTWETLDMFTGIMPKIKSEEKVSCITKFNVDEFSAWRSAFRECVKLYQTNQLQRLHIWMTKGKSKPFGQFAIAGAKDGFIFAKTHTNNIDELLKINDRDWLLDKFQQSIQTNK